MRTCTRLRMLKIPQCEVIEVREVEGPRGGKMLVMKLACGNLIWQQRKYPPKQVRCVPCWWEKGDADD